jgi:hypothetical protein
LFEHLKNFEEQTQEQSGDSSELGFAHEASLALELASDIRAEIFKLIDDTATHSFSFTKCLSYIQQARNEITASWDYKQKSVGFISVTIVIT